MCVFELKLAVQTRDHTIKINKQLQNLRVNLETKRDSNHLDQSEKIYLKAERR